MKIEILTLFPELFTPFFSTSLVGKSIQNRLVNCSVRQIRDHAGPPHYSVDDTPYGGGAGMVMKPEPLAAAIEAAKEALPNARIVLLSASGNRFSQARARSLSTHEELIFVCGRYEGIDHRIIDLFVDEEICIGDYVLMGGEVAAMVVMEAVIRLIPGVIGNSSSLDEESFSDPEAVEAPHYTRPPEFRGKSVPEVLLSGNHKLIDAWRRKESQRRTEQSRPDLLERGGKAQEHS